MFMPSVFIAMHAFRLASSFLTLGIFLSTFSFAAFPQTNNAERRFSVKGKPEIHVLNAQKITIRVWNKNEVWLLAESSKDSAELVKVETQLRGNKLEVVCPLPSEKSPPLMLHVPGNAVLELKTYTHKIEIKKPTGEVSISATENNLHFTVPESTELDLREVANVTRVSQRNGATAVLSAEGPRRIAGSQPQIKVTAKDARVLVQYPATGEVPDLSTVAAKTIANKNGLMSKALRERHPHLIPAPATSGESVDLKEKENQEEALKLETHLVNLNVTVTDRNGKAITGLTQNDFSIYEENVLQNVTFFSPEKAPFNLVLLLDMSGSVRDKIALIKETALHFLDVISPQDNVAVITFTRDVTVVSHLTNNREQLRESIRNLQAPVGGTSFYDALGYTLVEELSKVKGQRNAVIAITDGQDNALLSRGRRPSAVQKLMQQRMADAGISLPTPPHVGSYLTFKQLLDGVLEADALVYPIYLMPEGLVKMPLDATGMMQVQAIQSAQLAEQSEWQLQALADASGSKLFAAMKIEDLKEVYEQVAAELRTIYSLAYNPKNTSFKGEFRRLRIKVSTPGAAVRTRQGYYAK
jgi:VWFA-related protein